MSFDCNKTTIRQERQLEQSSLLGQLVPEHKPQRRLLILFILYYYYRIILLLLYSHIVPFCTNTFVYLYKSR